MSENVFAIPQPMRYRCQVHRYYSGLSRLYVRCYKDRQELPAFYLLFTDVGYWEGPVNWQGVDFQAAPHDDCIDLLVKTGIIGPAVLQFPDAYAPITEHVTLYVAQTLHTPVRVIAGSATRIPDIPAELK